MVVGRDQCGRQPGSISQRVQLQVTIGKDPSGVLTGKCLWYVKLNYSHRIL